MRVEIAAEDLQYVRDALWDKRALAAKELLRNRHLTQPRKDKAVGTKLIKRMNSALKKVHGHNCGGDAYV